MKTSLILVGAVAICVSLGGCQSPSMNSANLYNYDYDADPVYNIGYYGYRPYNWGDGYYTEDGWRDDDWNITKSMSYYYGRAVEKTHGGVSR